MNAPNTPLASSSEGLRRLFKGFNRFMMLVWRLGLASWGNPSRYGGAVMVLKHTGRKSGLTRHTPVNYAVVEGDVYCTAGFGVRSDWYRNILADPRVEIWLPDGRWAGTAADVTDAPERARLFRQVLIGSGFAGPLFGVNQKKLDDAALLDQVAGYRLIRIRRQEALTGPGGPGDLAWVWPLATLLLGLGLLRRRQRRRQA